MRLSKIADFARRAMTVSPGPPMVHGNPVSHLSGFELRHLTAHLAAAGRPRDLHRLLALEFAAEGGSTANAWYEAKLAAEHIDEYVADVAVAWDLAEDASQLALRDEGRSTTLALEVRYAGIRASLASRGRALPTALLIALVEHGFWSPARALSHARQRTPLPAPGGVIYDPDEDVRLVQRLTALGHGDLAAEHARTRQLPMLRSVALGAAGRPGEAVAVGASLSTVESRQTVIRDLAPYLGREELPMAEDILAQDPSPFVGDAVAALCGRWAQLGDGARAVELLSRPWGWDPDIELRRKADLLAAAGQACAEYLGEAELGWLLDHAVGLDAGDDQYRVTLLEALAPYLPPSLLGSARALAAGISREDTRAWVLLLLLDGQPSDVRERIREAAAPARFDNVRWRAFYCAAQRQTGDLRRQLLRDAYAAVDDYRGGPSAWDVLEMMEAAPEDLRQQWAAATFKRCLKLTPIGSRIEAVTRLARLMTEPSHSRYARYAYRAAAREEYASPEWLAEAAALAGPDCVLKLLQRLERIDDTPVLPSEDPLAALSKAFEGVRGVNTISPKDRWRNLPDDAFSEWAARDRRRHRLREEEIYDLIDRADASGPSAADRLLDQALETLLPAKVAGYYQPQDPWVRPTLAAALLRHGRSLKSAEVVVDGDRFPVSAFTHMVRLAPVALRPELVEEGRRRARQDFQTRGYFPEYAEPIEDLLIAAADLPDDLHDTLLREYLNDLEQERLRSPMSRDGTPLTAAVAFLGTHLAGRPGPLPYEVWRRALREASGYGRSCLMPVLASVAPLAPSLATADSAATLNAAITDVRRWWP